MTRRETTPAALFIIAVILAGTAIVTLGAGHPQEGIALIFGAVGLAADATAGLAAPIPPGNGPVPASRIRLRSNLFLLAALCWLVAAGLEVVGGSAVLAALFVLVTVARFVPAVAFRKVLQTVGPDGLWHRPAPSAPSAADVPSRGEDYEMVSVHTLLRRLGLQTADKDAQVDGVRRWLTEHEAGPGLVTSIERNGFGAALSSG